MKILYAGDSQVGGAANYLLGVLRSLRAKVRHVPPSATLSVRTLQPSYDAVILSDMPCRRVPRTSQRRIAEQVAGGAGLLMIGGWASFAGPLGGWRGSLVEPLLPVRCLRRDDRAQFPAGALVVRARVHDVLRGLSFAAPPAVCGFNLVQPVPGSRVVLGARPIVTQERLRLASRTYPLLVLGGDARRRTAALTTDAAPHWCAGLVDWGRRRVTLPVTGGISVEVGEQYLRLLANLIHWLARCR